MFFSSCQNNIKNTKINTWSLNKIDTWSISTWTLEKSTWAINYKKSSWSTDEMNIVSKKIDNISDDKKNKDIELDNSWKTNDFSWESQEQIVNDMSDYVDGLFNMIDKDVK